MTWYTQIVNKNTFFELLFQLDKKEFEKKHKEVCPCCGQGKLYTANYSRKPRGFAGDLDDNINIRFSLCCSEDGCRRRYNPASLRFYDRKVYFTAYFVLITCMRYGPNRYRLKKLYETYGVSTRTILRWRKYWKKKFPETELCRQLSGYFKYPCENFPEELFSRLINNNGEKQDTIILLLRNLSRAPPNYNTYAGI
jgi:hypothetical protein